MRLIKVRSDQLTIGRHRRGRGWAYSDATGARLSDPATRQRISALVIPPAWRDVRIAADECAHIQVFGYDEKGRGQYIYHPEWERRRASKKQKRLQLLTDALPRIRRDIGQGLAAEAGTPELALAIALALIDRTAMRVGRERYLEANGTRGAGTLYSRDVVVTGNTVTIKFVAKGNKPAHYTMSDPVLAEAITRIKAIRHRRLLVYRDSAGAVRALRTEMINRHLRKVAGAAVTAKDFRTLHASALAAEVLAGLQPGVTETQRKRQITAVTRHVADYLRNTPMISRKSYIAPCLFTLFDQGKLAKLWALEGRCPPGVKQRERRLGAVLAAL
jgi:DNA topoisomerase-1